MKNSLLATLEQAEHNVGDLECPNWELREALAAARVEAVKLLEDAESLFELRTRIRQVLDSSDFHIDCETTRIFLENSLHDTEPMTKTHLEPLWQLREDDIWKDLENVTEAMDWVVQDQEVRVLYRIKEAE